VPVGVSVGVRIQGGTRSSNRYPAVDPLGLRSR
jgi:hypothetical protein